VRFGNARRGAHCRPGEIEAGRRGCRILQREHRQLFRPLDTAAKIRHRLETLILIRCVKSEKGRPQRLAAAPRPEYSKPDGLQSGGRGWRREQIVDETGVPETHLSFGWVNVYIDLFAIAIQKKKGEGYKPEASVVERRR